IGLVANGRHMSVDQAHALAHGRVWTGQQALQNKLVDRLGGFDVAVERARALANITSNQRVELRYYPQAKNPFSALSRFFGASADAAQAMARFSAFVSDPRVQQAMAAMREEDANVRARAPDMHVR